MPEQDRESGAVPGSAQRRALLPAGLSAAPDTGMDRFARLVSRLLRVPVALVSLVDEDRQILPGMTGLPEPWRSAGRCRCRIRSAGT